jgi:RNA polymerase sigma-70 factor (ECF subfamily)
VHALAEPDLARDSTFERLYRAHAKDVYRYALAVLRNPADAEDVTQTTFLNAYRALARGDVPTKPQNWLIKIAHNACRTRYVQSARRPKEVPFEESIANLPVPEADAQTVHDLLVALSKLPFNQRSAIVMRELEGRTYNEIAETLGVTTAAVETLIFRARRSLRRERSALQALGAVQLPPSLASFLGGGSGGVLAGTGAVVGSGLVVKAVFAVLATVVASGIGFAAAGSAGPRHARLTALREPERPGALVAAAPTPHRATAASRPRHARASSLSALAQASAGRRHASPATATAGSGGVEAAIVPRDTGGDTARGSAQPSAAAPGDGTSRTSAPGTAPVTPPPVPPAALPTVSAPALPVPPAPSLPVVSTVVSSLPPLPPPPTPTVPKLP